MSARARLGWVALALVAAAGGWAIRGWGTARGSAETAPPSRVEPARTIETRSNKSRRTVVAEGVVVAPRMAQLKPRRPGKVREVLVREGERVRRGQPLARLEAGQPDSATRALQAAVESFHAKAEAAERVARAAAATLQVQQAAVEQARAERQRAQIESDRAEQLFREGLISRNDHARLVAATRAAELQVAEAKANLSRLEQRRRGIADRAEAAREAFEQAEARLKSLRRERSEQTLFSPVDGVAAQVNVSAGDVLGSSSPGGDAPVVMSLSEGSAAIVEAALSPRAKVRLGQSAEVEIEGLEGQDFRGRVVAVDGGEGRPGTTATVAIADPSRSVSAGMRARVRFIVGQPPGAESGPPETSAPVLTPEP